MIKNKLLEILEIKKFENDPILFLGLIHAKEWLHFLENNSIDISIFFDSDFNISDKWILSKLTFDFTRPDHFSRFNSKFNSGINSFNSNPSNIPDNYSNFQLEKVIGYFSFTNEKYGDICYHSVGDPFLFNINFNSRLSKTSFSFIKNNLSNFFLERFTNITVKARVEKILSIEGLSNYERNLLLCVPTFAIEDYKTTYNIIIELLSQWPNYKIHVGSATGFTDPLFHLIANFKKITNIGVQHGGGPISVLKDGLFEKELYQDYFYLPPFRKSILNIRGLKSLTIELLMLKIKFNYFLVNNDYTYEGLKTFLFVPLIRCFRISLIKFKMLFYFLFPPIPIIILSEWERYRIEIGTVDILCKENFYLKTHPLDAPIYNSIKKNFIQLGNIYEFNGSIRLENILFQWNNSYVLVMNYSVTLLVYLFEGIVPFIIVLNNEQIKECYSLLKDEDLILFNYLLNENVILKEEKFMKLNYKARFKIARNSKQKAIKITSTRVKIIQKLKKYNNEI